MFDSMDYSLDDLKNQKAILENLKGFSFLFSKNIDSFLVEIEKMIHAMDEFEERNANNYATQNNLQESKKQISRKYVEIKTNFFKFIQETMLNA